MKELKNRIFFILVAIETTFSLSMIVIFNITIYNREMQDILNKISRINNINVFNGNAVFVDDEIYIIKYNSLGEIENTLSFGNDSLTDAQIIDILNKKHQSIYYSDYLIFNRNDKDISIIINNKNEKKYMITSLIESAAILAILEIVIILLSKELTKKITNPIGDAFNKQKEFIYDASHELKTPLAIITASAETLEKDPKETKWLDNIKSEAGRMNELVTKLLTLSKSEDIKTKEEYKTVDLSKLIENKALSFESLMFENSLDLDIDVEKNIMFECVADRIKELLSIFIDNAIKHGEKGSKISIILKKEKNNILLTVKNKGEEIPINEREKIFERFYRIDKARNRAENRYGLGLSIAKNIAANHNATIKVECNGGYTSFITTFKKNKKV